MHAVVANCYAVVPLVQIMDSLLELFLIYFLVIIVKNMPNMKYKFLFLILICVNSELFLKGEQVKKIVTCLQFYCNSILSYLLTNLQLDHYTLRKDHLLDRGE